MLDKNTIYKKLVGITFTFAAMASMVYVYVLYGGPIDRSIHVVLNTASVGKQTKYWEVSKEYAEYAKARPPASVSVGDAQGVPVLLYHGIVPRADRFNTTIEIFKDQMFALKAAGYQTVTMADFIAFIRDGKKLPAKSFLLTFDDGRRDSYVNADPILKATGFRATMFVAVQDSMLGNPESYYIAPNDIRDMIDSKRWDIESHAVQETGGFVPLSDDRKRGNFLSNKAYIPSQDRLETELEYETRVARELGASKADLENFGIRVDAFAYLFGDYGDQTKNNPEAQGVIDSLVASNYRVAFRQVWPNDGEYELNYPDTDPIHLKRVETPTEWSGDQLVRFFETSTDKSLPYQDDLTVDNGWMELWSGRAMDPNGGFILSSDSKSSGAASFIDGAKTWKDYTFSATIDRVKGSYVSLMARYVDGQNYLTCSYGEGRVLLEEYVKGLPRTLNEVKGQGLLPEKGAKIGMSVSGRTANCLIDGASVVTATIPDHEGGIGARIWDRQLGNAEIRIREISVQPVPQQPPAEPTLTE